MIARFETGIFFSGVGSAFNDFDSMIAGLVVNDTLYGDVTTDDCNLSFSDFFDPP